MTVFTAGITENLATGDTVTPPGGALRYAVAASDALTMAGVVPGVGIATRMTQAMTFHGATSYVWTPGGGVVQLVKIGDSVSVRAVTHTTATERFKIAHTQTLGILVAVTEALNLSTVLQAYVGTVLLNKIMMQDVATARMSYAVNLADAFYVASILQRFTGVGLNDGFTVHAATSAQYQAVAQILQFLSVTVGQTYAMAFRLSVNSTLDMSDHTILNMIYRQSMTEIVDLDILYASLGGNTTAWTVNTRTGAVTEYQGWNFNSFVQFGNKYVAAAKDGLYELNGPTDNGISTIADIMGGFLQPAGPHLSGLKGVYLGQTGQGYWLLKVQTGDGTEYVYQRLSNPALMTTKFIIGKGINARYIGWELINVEGQDFDIDTIEFVPMIRARRI